MAKHLIDLDEDALSAARSHLATATIKDTVNESLRRASEGHRRRIGPALDALADADIDGRENGWR